VLESAHRGSHMLDEPKFEPDEGNCEVLRCANPGKYRALWPRVSKLVCETHRKDVTDKPWPEVAVIFGSAQVS
jgi:hypothetical protein